MSKLLDDLINEVEPQDSVQGSVDALLNGIANRIEGCNANKVKLSDLVTVLREDTAAIAGAALHNTVEAQAAKSRTQSQATYDAPSPAFDAPRENVRQGMVDSADDHRDQQFPENDNTEAERARIAEEQRARDRGQTVVTQEPLPA